MLKKSTLTAFVIVALMTAAESPVMAAIPGLTVVISPQSAAELCQFAEHETSLVHGLVSENHLVHRIQNDLLAAGKTGQVTISWWDGKRLPFVANTVNRLVSDQPISPDLQRVLAPLGQLVDRRGTVVFQEPWPTRMGEWTHYLHAPDGNAVTRDQLVGPPRQIHWSAGPQMLRHHDHLPSLSAMVSSRGRMFYIFDEAPDASILFSPQWKLIARDAFNGVVLWKRDIEKWHPHLWPLKSMPATLPRRLVSVGDRLFVTLGIEAPVSELDATDGSEIRRFSGSQRCEEIIVTGDTVFAVCLTGPGPLQDMDEQRGAEGKDSRATGFPYLTRLMGSNKSPLWLHARRRLIAFDRADGSRRWQVDGQFAPLSTATDGQRVYFHDGQSLQGLDYQTGKPLWTSPPIPIWKQFYACYGASLVVHDDVVLFSGGENFSWIPPGTKTGADDTMTAVAADDGRILWTARHPSSGYRSPEDLLVVQGMVWAPDTTKSRSSTLNGLDPHSGKIVRSLPLDLHHGFHHRCYPARATESYLLTSKVGINSIPFDGGEIVNDHWVRGSCGYGIMPANGLIYATPDPCNCYPESKLNGFAALAREDAGVAARRKEAVGKIPVVHGPAWPAASLGDQEIHPKSWPTYRANSARTASTDQRLPATLKSRWEQDLGAEITSPVVADGRVFVAAPALHTVTAIDAQTGRPLWTHVAGGRVDSPPTVVGDLAFYGAADGTVTCLRADNGRMVWRARLAPMDDRVVADGRIESVWPVHGSVTWFQGAIYALAGRNMFIDGGLLMAAFDPVTGRVRHVVSHCPRFDPDTGMDTIPSKPDILAADDAHLFMRSLVFDARCHRTDERVPHLFAVNGYLNDSWFHRSFWTYAADWKGGCGGFANTGNRNHSGRIMAVDRSDLYGYARERYGWGSVFTYRLYRAPVPKMAARPASGSRSGKRGKKRRAASVEKTERTWAIDVPVLARALVKAGDRLLIAGPRRLYEETEIVQRLPNDAAYQQIQQQEAEWQSHADLLIVDAEGGTVLDQMRLDYAPVWNGVAVAEDSLFIVGTDGILRCYR